MVGSFVTMTALEKLGLIVLIYGMAQYVAAVPVSPYVPRALMLGGGTLFIDGARLTRWLVRTWPGVRWE